ncbi:MAG TPA: hypothetical protein VFK43_03275, partial [Acidimicrobiales bacterium]|nr:hypothetical protein [Acidimicrobiales bacterium]
MANAHAPASATWAYLRHDLRRRGRSLAVLAVLIGLSSATVLAATAGARRGDSALDRLLERTRPATIAVLPNEAGFDWDRVRAIPGVEHVARFAVTSFVIEGIDEESTEFPYPDDGIMDAIERPVVLDGRIADPAQDDELMVTQAFTADTGLGVGDHLTIHLHTPEQIDQSLLSQAAGPPEGPVIEARIVGVIRSPWFSDTPGAPGRVIPSPGLFTRHEANIVGREEAIHLNALVRLADGQAGIPAFREHLVDVTGRRDIEFFDLAAMAQHADEVNAFEANSLLAFAAAAGVAATVLLGQALARTAAVAAADLEVLRALGFTTALRRSVASLGPILAGLAGAGLGLAGAIVASSHFPTGSASVFEPSPGRHVDGAVLGIGSLAVVILVAAVSTASAQRVALGRRRPVASCDSVARRLARAAGVPVPVAVGAQFAFEPGHGARSVPVRPAIVGAVTGVLGIVASLTFGTGIQGAIDHPERFGQITQIELFLGFNDEDFGPSDDLVALAADDPDVVSVNDTRQAVAQIGSQGVATFAIDTTGEPLRITLVDGDRPTAGNEIVLAPSVADGLGVGLGDRVDLEGTEGDSTFLVTGTGFVLE